jgi:uncharacterized protein YdeI (YjbR/CyaY-like superfamily)
MTAKAVETLEVANRQAWRKWLADHHDDVSEIWLVFYKRHTGIRLVGYDEAVEEALCYGWIDSLIRRLDDDCYARKFTPRKIDSKWSDINRQRYADLKARGLLAKPGINRPPTRGSDYAPRPAATEVPPYMEEWLKSNPQAWRFFEQLAPSYRRAYIGWIDSAKRPETREKRLNEALERLAAGKKLGLK